jgi:two-component system, NtrC family, nitrogen regulation response regulator GlnG
MPRLLVVDDDRLTLECFRLLFPSGKVTVLTAASAAEGVAAFSDQHPDVVVLDIRLPDLSGLEAFRQLHELDARIPIILMTGHGRADTAIEAMRLGAYEYVLKPLDTEILRKLIERAFEISRLMRVPAKLGVSEATDDDSDLLVGKCPAMQEVYKAVGRVATQDVTVLVLGESGTGKELVARAIYQYSDRCKGPFLTINCAAIPETLLESELFGHEKGSFTGADRKRVGKFEQCDGGTIFLDEIGDMTPATQTKILRVLQEKQFERVGGNEPIKVDVRVIAATNRKLEEMVSAGEFRGDLYYRLNVYTINLPPLRERPGDLGLLADHFLRRFGRELRKPMDSIAPEAMNMLAIYTWPGNVRELQSMLKKAILHATGPMLLPEFLPEPIRTISEFPSPNSSFDKESDFRDLERYIEDRLRAGTTDLDAELRAVIDRLLLVSVLTHAGNNLTQAARTLGISRATLRSRLAALGISLERSTSLEEDMAE